MHSATITILLLAALALALTTAAVTDARRRQIDNWLNAAIALAAPLFWLASGLTLAAVGWQVALAVGAFAVLTGLFAIGAMGGGDVKLLTALALWVRPLWFMHLITVMAVAGGVLTVVLAMWHVARRDRQQVVVPYGIAIAAGGLWVMVADCLPTLHAPALLG